MVRSSHFSPRTKRARSSGAWNTRYSSCASRSYFGSTLRPKYTLRVNWSSSTSARVLCTSPSRSRESTFTRLGERMSRMDRTLGITFCPRASASRLT